MKKIVSILLGILAIVVLVGLFVFAYFDSLPQEIIKITTPLPTISVNYSNFATVIAKNSVVKAIPSESTISLRFYNFDSGERVFEKSYLITTGKIIEGTGDSDIALLLHSKYLKELTNKNFCSIIQKANKNGDLGFETNLSSVALAWKMKSMYQYKECLGM